MIEQQIYGYVRVSSKDQNIARQIKKMQENNVPTKNIYIDKVSGATFTNRTQYQKLLRRIHAGDTIIICSLDRLGRNFDEIQENWHLITKEKQVNIKVLDMPILDISNDDDLMHKVMSEMVLLLLSYFADIERKYIKERQAQGIEIAKAQGVQFGRRPNELPQDFDTIYSNWTSKKWNTQEISSMLGCTPQKFYTYVRRYRHLQGIKKQRTS